MHMRKALLVSDDVHTAAWVRQGLAKLDLAIIEVRSKDLVASLAEVPEFGLVVVDGGRTPDPLAQRVENAVSEGAELALMLIVEPEALAALRLPTRIRSDFFVRGGSSDELLARVRALAWPGEEASTQELVRIGELTVNLATYQAYLHGEPIDFAYLEYALFAFLVTHPGRTYSREVLLRRVWGTDYYGGSRTVDVHVRRIRSKIGGELSERLETVRNVGYLWRG
jgi:DNA-binding response OmpR family regulator